MEPSADDVERIPRENLRVRREEFAAVWAAAERLAVQPVNGRENWYALGVRKKCRWIACARERDPIDGSMGLSPPPISATTSIAHEEAIQAEAEKADYFLALEARGIKGPAGMVEAIASTLNWAWRGSRRPPLNIQQAASG